MMDDHDHSGSSSGSGSSRQGSDTLIMSINSSLCASSSSPHASTSMVTKRLFLHNDPTLRGICELLHHDNYSLALAARIA